MLHGSWANPIDHKHSWLMTHDSLMNHRIMNDETKLNMNHESWIKHCLLCRRVKSQRASCLVLHCVTGRWPNSTLPSMQSPKGMWPWQLVRLRNPDANLLVCRERENGKVGHLERYSRLRFSDRFVSLR